jgi:hypothetical protein
MSPGATAKSSWPLVTLGALSFVPGFGFFIAAVALTWALVSDRPRARLAGILAVAGAVCQLVFGALVLHWYSASPEYAKATQESTRLDLAKVVAALEDFHGEHHAYPANLQLLVGYPLPVRMINITDQSGGLRHLGQLYAYRLAPDGKSYDLFARGPDGQAGTDDDIRPRLDDSLAEHSGYRPAP